MRVLQRTIIAYGGYCVRVLRGTIIAYGGYCMRLLQGTIIAIYFSRLHTKKLRNVNSSTENMEE